MAVLTNSLFVRSTVAWRLVTFALMVTIDRSGLGWSTCCQDHWRHLSLLIMVKFWVSRSHWRREIYSLVNCGVVVNTVCSQRHYGPIFLSEGRWRMSCSRFVWQVGRMRSSKKMKLFWPLALGVERGFRVDLLSG